MILPLKPMSPILQDQLPTGDEWLYQLKWDGARIIAEIRSGKVTLFSKNMQVRNDSFPELVSYLQQIRSNCILDGEAVVIEPTKQRPDFHSILKRLRFKKNTAIELATRTLPVTYVLFDLIAIEDQDVRTRNLMDRYDRLQQLFPERNNQCLVTDIFIDGEALFEWVKLNQWEGVVSKKAGSLYHEGKHHSDWYKTKVLLTYEVDIVGYTINEGRVASLVMTLDDIYCGKASAGLNQTIKKQLLDVNIVTNHTPVPIALPADVSPVNIRWLSQPFTAIVTSSEMTDHGHLRHPKIVQLRGMD